MAYAIVEFLGYGSHDIIPVSWFTSDEEDRCYWPSTVSKSNVGKMVMAKAAPSSDWTKFDVRVLGKAG